MPKKKTQEPNPEDPSSIDYVERGYCVYLHRDNATGQVFYIGKGKKKRPYSRNPRQQRWKEFVAKLPNGYSVEIVEENLSEDEAFFLERRQIEEYGRKSLGTGALLNKSGGGDLDFGEGDVIEFIVSHPNLKSNDKEEPWFKELTPKERVEFAEFVGNSMREFCKTFNDNRREDIENETYFEMELEDVFSQLSMNSDHFVNTKISYRDFVEDVEFQEYFLGGNLEEVEPKNENPAMVALAKTVHQFLIEQIEFLRKEK